jgi:hypothetical protein
MSTSTNTGSAVLVPRIEGRIQVNRGLRVMIDVNLAALYEVETKRLNEQVKRNRERFPADFLFQLNAAEKAEVVANCDHLEKLKFSKVLPYAFTEHGAIQAANVLASAQVVEMGIYVVRAFVQLRQASAVHADLSKRLTKLELSHDTFSRNTRKKLRQVFDALRELAEKVTPTEPPDPPKRPIGFLTHEDTKDKPKSITKALKVGRSKKA